MYVCMYVWSSHIAEYGSTGQGCQSCSWSAEQGKVIPLSPCVPENLVSRDGFSRPIPRQPAHLHTISSTIKFMTVGRANAIYKFCIIVSINY